MTNIQKRINTKGDTTYRVQVRLKAYEPQEFISKIMKSSREWLNRRGFEHTYVWIQKLETL